MKTIDEKLVDLGDSFRGLWYSRNIIPGGKIGGLHWSATFLYKNEIVETSPCSSPHMALDFALEMVEKD